MLNHLLLRQNCQMGQGAMSGWRHGPLTTEDVSGMFMRSFQSCESHVYLFCLNHLNIKDFFSFSLTWVLWKSSLDLPGFLPMKWRQYRGKLKQEKNKFSFENITWDPRSLKEGWYLPWSKPRHLFFLPKSIWIWVSHPLQIRKTWQI